MEKFEKETNVISVGQPGSGGSIGFDSPEEIFAEAGESIQNLAEF